MAARFHHLVISGLCRVSPRERGCPVSLHFALLKSCRGQLESEDPHEFRSTDTECIDLNYISIDKSENSESYPKVRFVQSTCKTRPSSTFPGWKDLTGIWCLWRLHGRMIVGIWIINTRNAHPWITILQFNVEIANVRRPDFCNKCLKPGVFSAAWITVSRSLPASSAVHV